MSELHSIPLTCKEGVYSVFDFYQDADGEDAIFFDYDTQYQMLTYDIPVGQDWRGMTLYSVPEKDIFRTLRACYGEDGGLLRITAVLNGHETLLYIRYEDEAGKQYRTFSKKEKEPGYKPAACDISVRIGCYDSDITEKLYLVARSAPALKENELRYALGYGFV